jgi:hypothetical protein
LLTGDDFRIPASFVSISQHLSKRSERLRAVGVEGHQVRTYEHPAGDCSTWRLLPANRRRPAQFRPHHRVRPACRLWGHLSACRSASTRGTSPPCSAGACRVVPLLVLVSTEHAAQILHLTAFRFLLQSADREARHPWPYQGRADLSMTDSRSIALTQRYGSAASAVPSRGLLSRRI